MSANGIIGGAIAFSLFSGIIGGLLGGLLAAIAAAILGGVVGGGIGIATHDIFLRCWIRITGPPSNKTLTSSEAAFNGKYMDTSAVTT